MMEANLFDDRFAIPSQGADVQLTRLLCVAIKLCQRCRAVLATAPELGGPIDCSIRGKKVLAISAQDFLDGVHSRCAFCTKLWDGLTTSEYRNVRQGPGSEEMHTDSSRRDNSEITITAEVVRRAHDARYIVIIDIRIAPHVVAELQLHSRSRCISYTCWPMSGCDDFTSEDAEITKATLQTYHHTRVVSDDESSEPLALPHEALLWFQKCRQSHVHCKLGTHKGWSPKRLLELDLGSSRPTCRIVETANMQSRASYASLSHRWGDARFLKLMQSNNVELRAGLEIGRLPRTFQDAITVCCALGIGYLWIDSLCIMQDDDEDWAEQAQQMSGIYANSVLNIAAQAIKDSSETMLKAQKLPHFLHWAHPGPSTHDGMLPAGKYVLSDGSFWYQNVIRSSLSERGWVLQEHVMSRRTLHFTADGLLWECRTKACSPEFVHGVPDEILRYMRIPKMEQDRKVESNNDSVHGMTGTQQCVTKGSQSQMSSNARHSVPCIFCEKWCRWIQELSKREFTFFRDRPFAISGLVDAVARSTGKHCLAGVWQDHMELQLMWLSNDQEDYTTSNASSASERQHDFPSWSWLSSIGPIRFDAVGDCILSIIEVNVESPRVSQDRLITQQGWIKMRAGLLPVVLRAGFWLGPYATIIVKLGLESFKAYAQKDCRHSDQLSDSHDGEYFCVPSVISPFLKGLLVKLISRRLMTFRRIGFVSISYDMTEPRREALEDFTSRLQADHLDSKLPILFLV